MKLTNQGNATQLPRKGEGKPREGVGDRVELHPLTCANCGAAINPDRRRGSRVQVNCGVACHRASSRFSDPNKEAKVKELRSAGFGWKRISNEIGVPKTTLMKVARRIGIAIHGERMPIDGAYMRQVALKNGNLYPMLKVNGLMSYASESERISVSRFDQSAHWVNHPEAIRFNERMKSKRRWVSGKSDPEFRLSKAIRCCVYQAITGAKAYKKSKTFGLVGCSAAELVRFIEDQFELGMSWDNYGSHWHVDHVRPLSSFDLRDEQEQAQAFHYSNLRPLPKDQNLAKSAHRSAKTEREHKRRFAL